MSADGVFKDQPVANTRWLNTNTLSWHLSQTLKAHTRVCVQSSVPEAFPDCFSQLNCLMIKVWLSSVTKLKTSSKSQILFLTYCSGC